MAGRACFSPARTFACLYSTHTTARIRSQKIVSAQWIVDSLAQRRRLPTAPYLVYQRAGPGQQRLRFGGSSSEPSQPASGPGQQPSAEEHCAFPEFSARVTPALCEEEGHEVHQNMSANGKSVAEDGLAYLQRSMCTETATGNPTEAPVGIVTAPDPATSTSIPEDPVEVPVVVASANSEPFLVGAVIDDAIAPADNAASSTDPADSTRTSCVNPRPDRDVQDAPLAGGPQQPPVPSVSPLINPYAKYAAHARHARTSSTPVSPSSQATAVSRLLSSPKGSIGKGNAEKRSPRPQPPLDPRAAGANPDFIEQFLQSSRLHHLSTTSKFHTPTLLGEWAANGLGLRAF